MIIGFLIIISFYLLGVRDFLSLSGICCFYLIIRAEQ